MRLYSKTLSLKLYNWTSKGNYTRRYGFLASTFFIAGAGLEFAMIHWRPNGHNFCKIFFLPIQLRVQKFYEKYLKHLFICNAYAMCN